MTKKKDKTPKQRKFEILRTGSYTDANDRDDVITLSDLQQLANNYSIKTFRSPLVTGHPKDNEGALGWVDSLIVVNDRLYALVTLVHKNLAKAIKQGLYKKISISIFGAKSPANQIPGELYLRHVGILGAVASAISGLEEIDDTNISESIEQEESAELIKFNISFSEH